MLFDGGGTHTAPSYWAVIHGGLCGLRRGEMGRWAECSSFSMSEGVILRFVEMPCDFREGGGFGLDWSEVRCYHSFTVSRRPAAWSSPPLLRYLPQEWSQLDVVLDALPKLTSP